MNSSATRQQMPPRKPGRSEIVRAVVISDIHATFDAKEAETHVAQATAPDGNALTAARTFLAERIESAHMLLCPGDMVHRGDPKPMDWVWRELQQVATDLGATLVGTVGNHDLLRKPKGAQEPQQELRRLLPPFPYDDDLVVKTYWADHFGVVETSDWRVVTVNTCCQHGGFDQKEAEFGRLMPYCLPAISAFLEEADSHPQVNICMCHHHPQEWSHGGEHATKHLLGGDLLIDLLDSREERWLLLHGHKHYPAVGYFGHSTHGPVRLSAGSAGINLLPDTGVEIGNQMHVIDFAVDVCGKLGLPIGGEIASYTWEGNGAWAPASGADGLPSLVGFGYRRDGRELARELLEKAKHAGRGVYEWQDIVDLLDPRVRFLAPSDREELFRGIVRLGGGVAQDESLGFLQITFP